MGEYLRIGCVNLSVEGATLREDRWGLSGRLAVTILPIHLHGFSQVLLDPTGSITVYAVNGGITLTFRRLILNLFAGVFGTDLFSRALFSYGAQARLFCLRGSS